MGRGKGSRGSVVSTKMRTTFVLSDSTEHYLHVLHTGSERDTQRHF